MYRTLSLLMFSIEMKTYIKIFCNRSKFKIRILQKIESVLSYKTKKCLSCWKISNVMSTHYCLEIELANFRPFSNQEQISAQFSSCIIYSYEVQRSEKSVCLIIIFHIFLMFEAEGYLGANRDSFNFFSCCSVFQNTEKYSPHSVRLWRDASPSKERRQRKSKAGRPREADQRQGHRPLAYVKCVCLENKMVLVL